MSSSTINWESSKECTILKVPAVVLVVPDGPGRAGFGEGERAAIATRLLVFWSSGNSNVYGKIENIKGHLIIR